MTDTELEEQLTAKGCRLGHSVMSEDGMILRNINGTFMFRLDAVDLATGAATLEQIVQRNKGKVFPNAPE